MAKGKVIAVMGAKSGMGASVIGSALAFSYGLQNQTKTLIVDFDQRACGDQSLVTGIKTKQSVRELSQFNGNVDCQ